MLFHKYSFSYKILMIQSVKRDGCSLTTCTEDRDVMYIIWKEGSLSIINSFDTSCLLIMSDTTFTNPLYIGVLYCANVVAEKD